MNVRLLMLIVFSPVFTMCAAQSGESLCPNVEETLEKLFDAAKKQDAEALAGLKGEVEHCKSRIVEVGYAVALYMSAPSTHKRQFVQMFPDDRDGIAEVFNRIESKGLTPHFMYSVAALGKIAADGDGQAIDKIIAGGARSDGAVAVAYCAEVIQAMGVAAHRSVRAVIHLSEVEQGRVVACFEELDAKERAVLENRLVEALGTAGTKRERQVIERILGVLRG